MSYSSCRRQILRSFMANVLGQHETGKLVLSSRNTRIRVTAVLRHNSTSSKGFSTSRPKCGKRDDVRFADSGSEASNSVTRLGNASKGSDTTRGRGRAPPPTELPLRARNFLRRGGRESWQVQKAALESKFGPSNPWNPRKRLSPDAMDGIRALHAQYPEKYTTAALAQRFEVSPEAIRRILKSKWRPSEEEEDSRRERWERRGERIWSRLAEQGFKPPKQWRYTSVGQSENRHETEHEHEHEQDSWNDRIPWSSSDATGARRQQEVGRDVDRDYAADIGKRIL